MCVFCFYLLEAIVHHRAKNLRHHEADPDGQQQAGDDPHRGDHARSAGHVGEAPVRLSESEGTGLPLGGARKESLQLDETADGGLVSARRVQRATPFSAAARLRWSHFS